MSEYYNLIKKQEKVIKDYKRLCLENGFEMKISENEILIIRNVNTKRTINEYKELMEKMGYKHSKEYLENRFNKEEGATIIIGLNMKEDYQVMIELKKGKPIKRNLNTIIKELENI